jgi:hypothetical protein
MGAAANPGVRGAARDPAGAVGRRRRGAAVLLLLALIAPGSAAAASRDGEARTGKSARPILQVMNEVVDGLIRAIAAGPTEESRRVSVRDGLFGLGPYRPRGGADGGVAGPPLQLFPRAGLGVSLNVDPTTGSYYR